ELIYDMMLHKEFDARLPPLAQSDDVFVEAIRHFDTPDADRMLQIPKLRALMLPTIRAEFGMAYNYVHRPVAPFRFPITSFVGHSDPWVSPGHSAAWGELTCGGFTSHLRQGSHFLMEDDPDFILQTITTEFVDLAAQWETSVQEVRGTSETFPSDIAAPGGRGAAARARPRRAGAGLAVAAGQDSRRTVRRQRHRHRRAAPG